VTGHFALLSLFTLAGFSVAAGGGGEAALPPGTVVTPAKLGFDELFARLEQAVMANGLLVIAKPSASRNAAARHIEIPGNGMILAFNSDFAVRVLKASAAAGFEAPMRLYVTENPDRTATVTYRTASALFAPYRVPALDAVAEDLDRLFAKIVAEAIAR
jgi:uncharacterized protein (DUF302 family)